MSQTFSFSRWPLRRFKNGPVIYRPTHIDVLLSPTQMHDPELQNRMCQGQDSTQHKIHN